MNKKINWNNKHNKRCGNFYWYSICYNMVLNMLLLNFTPRIWEWMANDRNKPYTVPHQTERAERLLALLLFAWRKEYTEADNLWLPIHVMPFEQVPTALRHMDPTRIFKILFHSFVRLKLPLLQDSLHTITQ